MNRLTDATKFLRLAVLEFGKPRPRSNETGPRTSWNFRSGAVLFTVAITLTGEVCKRVKVGTKTVTREEDVYEIQCPPEEPDIDIEA